MAEGTQRRLAAIVSADVVGYSRLMGVDEVGTLAALRAHRAEMIDAKIAEHGGRIVKTMGDGLLLEFPSVVGATQCVIEVQKGMAERNQGVDEDLRITFRVGINLGDIIIEGADILGDAVNIAARLQEIAEPCGICISNRVHEDVQDRLDDKFEDTGEIELKNIARPVRVWRWTQNITSVAVSPTAEALPLPDKPSIAVLPFDNMSGDPEQEYFADGMTEDLTTDLSKVSGLFVVARNSTFAYKGKKTDARKVSRELGVRYLLEGSVRRAGSRVRINAQLIDAATGGHLWAERYDGTVDDVFELQDEVGSKVIRALAVALSPGERSRMERVHTNNLDAYELYVRAMGTPYPPIKERIFQARDMFETVIELDPNFAGGYSGVSRILYLSVMYGISENSDEDIDLALSLAQKAVEVDDTFGSSYTSLATALLLKRSFDQAIEAAREAIRRQPSDADAHAHLGFALALAGRADEGVLPIEQAIRFNPQFHGPYLNILGFTHFTRRCYDEAVQAFRTNVGRGGPLAYPAMCWWLASHVGLNQMEDAHQMAHRVVAEFPGFTVSSWSMPRLYNHASDVEHLRSALRLAGLPE